MNVEIPTNNDWTVVPFGLIAIGILVAIALALWWPRPHPRCVFDRNELGPMGEYGQWYWDIYKCSDGTSRRQLVAGPRG